MKIAIVLTGHHRQYKHCYPSVKEFLLDKHDVDIYLSTWDHNFFDISRKHDVKPTDPQPVIDLYKPVKVHVEDHIQYYKNKSLISMKRGNVQFSYNGKTGSAMGCECQQCPNNSCNAFENIRDQWYIVQKGFNLIDNPEQYDYIMKLRLDVIFQNLVINENLPKNTLVLPEKGFDAPHWPDYVANDQIAYGDPESMMKYGNFYDSYVSCAPNLVVTIKPEWAIGYYLAVQSGINIVADNVTLRHSLCHHLPDE